MGDIHPIEMRNTCKNSCQNKVEKTIMATRYLIHQFVYFSQEVDLGIAIFTITKDRSEAVEFLTPFWEDSLTFLVRIPKEDKTLLYLSPFTVSVVMRKNYTCSFNICVCLLLKYP